MAFRSFKDFENGLQRTLNHYYDPLFQPEGQILEILGIPSSQDIEALRQALRSHINEMKPAEETPSSAYTHRFYEILHSRYLESISQEETALHLNMTSRNLRRNQQLAVRLLAQRIWNTYQASQDTLSTQSAPAVSGEDLDYPILKELEVLLRNSPGSVSEVVDCLTRVQMIANAMLQPRQIVLEPGGLLSPITISVHPSILDQILLSTIEQLEPDIPGGRIRFKAVEQEGWAEIILQAEKFSEGASFTVSKPITRILELIGGLQTIQQNGDQISIAYRFPLAATIPVLLVDDNPDFYYLFKRFAQHTRYIIHGIHEGAQLRSIMAEIKPNIVLLDVLLPDMDGWQLLIDLHKTDWGYPVFVVVCSAVGQKDLAYSLGASAYLPKPVTREQFLNTLDGLHF